MAPGDYAKPNSTEHIDPPGIRLSETHLLYNTTIKIKYLNYYFMWKNTYSLMGSLNPVLYFIFTPVIKEIL